MDLPQWATDRGHPLPNHDYYFRNDWACMVNCPEESQDLNLWTWKCWCEVRISSQEAT